MSNRQNTRDKWLRNIFKEKSFTIKALAGDASFRQYYRVSFLDNSWIVMDAPPEKETLQSFIAIDELLRCNNIHAPEILAVDENHGFALLEDFGDSLLLNVITPDNVDALYQTAIQTLHRMQQCQSPHPLLNFDAAFMLQEMQLCTQWFLQSYLQLSLSFEEEKLIHTTFEWLANEIFQQPKVFIHRDYHSRNIMLLKDDTDLRLGIIDFQDAMHGSLTYDLVSLLKDCYIQWPKEDVMRWLALFYEESCEAKQYSQKEFVRAFDLCGLQRHLKVLGVFSRLYLRDNKPGFLKDLPLTLHYVLDCLETYKELQPLYQFMEKRVHLP